MIDAIIKYVANFCIIFAGYLFDMNKKSRISSFTQEDIDNGIVNYKLDQRLINDLIQPSDHFNFIVEDLWGNLGKKSLPSSK